MPETFRFFAAGASAGRALVLEEPLSFWGGLDPNTGVVINKHHPQHGLSVTNRMLFMPHGSGSSSSSSVILEAIRLKTHPAGIVLREPDEIIALGAIVGRQLYGISVPVVVVGAGDYDSVTDGDLVEVSASGLHVRGS